MSFGKSCIPDDCNGLVMTPSTTDQRLTDGLQGPRRQMHGGWMAGLFEGISVVRTWPTPVRCVNGTLPRRRSPFRTLIPGAIRSRILSLAGFGTSFFHSKDTGMDTPRPFESPNVSRMSDKA